MRQEHWNKIIEYFNVMLPQEPKPTLNIVRDINNTAAKVGYAIHPDICNHVIKNWIESIQMNPNSTFYRKWSDIANRNRMQLYLDQLLHYASTYGTDFEGEVYCPNGDPIEIDYQLYKIISPVTEDELRDKIMTVLGAGIALKSDIVEAFCEWLLLSPQAINIDAVKNREALVYLCARLHKYPSDPETLVRYIFYITTGSPMLIQSKQMLLWVEMASDRIDLTLLDAEQLKGLATIFNRYKRIFMALKSNPKNKRVVNKISSLSKKYHKPFKPGFWENITNIQHISDELLDRKVSELTNPFKIIKLLEMIKLRKLQSTNNYDRVFVIRNGKLWVDKHTKVPYPCDFDNIWLKLSNRLIELMRVAYDNLAAHRDTPIRIKLPNCELMCPSSEKKFVGNLPMGSYYNLTDHDNYFGIYWRNEWGTRDFDLSFIVNGRKVGWNGGYRDRDILFSGDMTNADPQATEMLYIKDEVPDGAIYVNRFSGEVGSKFRLFFGQDKCDGFRRNYMVDPNSIVLEDMLTSDAREQMVGYIFDKKVYFLNLGCGDQRASTVRHTDYMKACCCSHIPLAPILEMVGYKIVTEKPDIDLSTPSKEKILKLFI